MTSKSQSVMNMALVTEGGMLLLALSLGLLMPRGPLAQIDWSTGQFWRNALWGGAACLPLLALLLLLRCTPLAFLKRFKQLIDELVLPMFGELSLLQLAVIAMLAGVGEELLFRGVIQQAISDRFGWPIGLVSTSVLFGLAHALSRTYAVLAGLIGAYFGSLCIWTGDLLPAIVAHGLYDFCALVFLVRMARPVE
jgi:membrane protease YdiL (CAAX protease family)